MGMLLNVEEKLSFYDELKCRLDIHGIGDFVICLGDFMDTLIGILMDSVGLTILCVKCLV